MTRAPIRPLRVGLLAYGLDRPATGIARYAVEVAKAIARQQPRIELVLLAPFAQPVDGLAELPRIRLRGTRLLPAMMTLGPAQLAVTAARHRLDVIHDPAGIAPFLVPRWPATVGRVATVHDTVPFVHPETHARLTNLLFHRYLPPSLARADRVVTVSEASRRDIERFLGVNAARIARIYCGIDDRFRPQPPGTVAATLGRYGVRFPYLLAVGALQARKNLESVFEAYARLRWLGIRHGLVVVGPKAWKSEGIFRRIEALGLGDDVSLTGFVDDRDLPALYAGAHCFVFPSLYEGFGLPPLEAMACGAPVVASNTSSLPEVVGDAGILVGPTDVDALTDAITRVVTRPEVANDLRERGFRQSRRFSWETAAEAHAELYEQVHADRLREAR